MRLVPLATLVVGALPPAAHCCRAASQPRAAIGSSSSSSVLLAPADRLGGAHIGAAAIALSSTPALLCIVRSCAAAAPGLQSFVAVTRWRLHLLLCIMGIAAGAAWAAGALARARPFSRGSSRTGGAAALLLALRARAPPLCRAGRSSLRYRHTRAALLLRLTGSMLAHLCACRCRAQSNPPVVISTQPKAPCPAP